MEQEMDDINLDTWFEKLDALAKGKKIKLDSDQPLQSVYSGMRKHGEAKKFSIRTAPMHPHDKYVIRIK